MSSAY